MSNSNSDLLLPQTLNLREGVLSILIPLFNERYLFEHILKTIMEVPLPLGLEREIVIVDDCSTDGSRELLQKVATEHEDVIQAYYHPRNRGKGAAIRTAIEHATGCYTIIQDSDLEYDPNDYGVMLEPLLKGVADVVYGSRFAGRKMRSVLNYHHALGNMFLTHLSNFTTGLFLTDMETCYKAFRTDILKTLPLRSDRFGIEPEITAKISKRGCRVYEVPISYCGRSYQEGKKINWKDGISAIYTIFKFWILDDCYNQKYAHQILTRLSSARNFTRWMVHSISPWFGERILEIGSGIGNISRHLPRRETLTLTDINPLYMNILKTAFRDDPRISVRKVDLTCDDDFIALGDSSHDTVILLNVLEHIEDDLQALKRIYKLLAPQGRVIVLVPQYQFLFGSYDETVDHKRRYSKTTLLQRLSEAGFNVEWHRNFNVLAIPGWWLNSVLFKRKEMGKYQLKIFDLLVPIMRVIESVLPLPGISLVAVAKKDTR